MALRQCGVDTRSHNRAGDYYIGIMYLNGLGVPQDVKKAKLLFHDAAISGNANAQYELANLFVQEKKWGSALLWYKKSVSAHPSSLLKMAEISKILFLSSNKPSYRISYVSFLNQAREKSIYGADVLLATDYLTGFGVPIDKEKSYRLFKSYLTNYDHDKKPQISLSRNVSYLSLAQMNYGILLYDYKRDYSLSLKMLLKGYKTAQSCYLIAKMYQLGLGTEQDLKLSLSWYKVAASKKSASSTQWMARALFAMSDFYQNGLAVKESQSKFLSLITTASRLGNLKATEKLASMYETGGYLQKDEGKAMRLYYLARNMGSKVAREKIKQYEIKKKKLFETPCSRAYSRIIINTANRRRSKKSEYADMMRICHQGARQGNAEDIHTMGKIYYFGRGVKRDIKKALKYWSSSADKGNPNGIYYLALIYYKGVCPTCIYKNPGSFVVLPNYSLAVKLMKQYVSNKHSTDKRKARFFNFLGYLYSSGDVPISLYKSYDFYRQSADLNNALGLYNLATIYYGGRPFLKRDIKKAINLYEKSARAGSRDSYAVLCSIYSSRVSALDHKKAFIACTKGADLGFKESMYQLGRLYHYGLGTSKNKVMARFWYAKSASLGDKKSMMQLKMLGE